MVIINIKLENGWTLSSNGKGLVLSKGKSNKYYSSIESALNGYIKQRILESQAGTLKELLDAVERLENYIRDISKGF